MIEPELSRVRAKRAVGKTCLKRRRNVQFLIALRLHDRPKKPLVYRIMGIFDVTSDHFEVVENAELPDKSVPEFLKRPVYRW